MPTFGGFNPFPRKFGGGTPRPKLILDSLNADRGTAFNTEDRTTIVYVENLAIARAISAAWGTNQRLANIWDPHRCSVDILERWEKLLALAPPERLVLTHAPSDQDAHDSRGTEYERRHRVHEHLMHVGIPSLAGHLIEDLEHDIADAFVAVEYIPVSLAAVFVPDGTYPFGTVSTASPWSSTVAHVLVRLQKPATWTESEFYSAAGLISSHMDRLLPAWVLFDWYRPGPVYETIAGGPSAVGFFLDDEHNLDNQILGSSGAPLYDESSAILLTETSETIYVE